MQIRCHAEDRRGAAYSDRLSKKETRMDGVRDVGNK